jgi:hypothetical protein
VQAKYVDPPMLFWLIVVQAILAVLILLWQAETIRGW